MEDFERKIRKAIVKDPELIDYWNSLESAANSKVRQKRIAILQCSLFVIILFICCNILFYPLQKSKARNIHVISVVEGNKATLHCYREADVYINNRDYLTSEFYSISEASDYYESDIHINDSASINSIQLYVEHNINTIEIIYSINDAYIMTLQNNDNRKEWSIDFNITGDYMGVETKHGGIVYIGSLVGYENYGALFINDIQIDVFANNMDEDEFYEFINNIK